MFTDKIAEAFKLLNAILAELRDIKVLLKERDGA